MDNAISVYVHVRRFSIVFLKYKGYLVSVKILIQ